MKLVIQRVKEASVTVGDTCIGCIEQGFLVFAGIGREDTPAVADRFIKKMTGLRIFEDENGKTNLSLKDVGGQILLVSQFTLYANCKKGNRPSFTECGEPKEANRLYEYMIQKIRETGIPVQTGEFGAEMKVSLINDGPFTILLDDKTFE
ncbi:D-tyrosyl-tRNA(Tyr) deacylase [Lactonifactor longoviformis]|uniref:D-aminoacyl-tRNA deacylase n=1 Tax=Lactonifactor longoviformis DSM 17459 TaxID=1122155 RepID=A0A1M4ZM71_9CLOT|nr:D-aminoacyl-tRNA deacylase [Lactonifactor longoviformis]POP30749.1 D-tyrosyl-tRNA(Tyr) deacylase [Lactonifactor longoviformis]SHF18897.1 D-tyrosyl-tRNA(Tyr) deacylase [Lactonifactor longoviformis DSM 17459]